MKETSIEELFEEYGYLTAEVHNGDCNILEAKERMQEIIKELEASIRKEVVEDILEQLLKEARKTDYADRTEYDVAYDFIKGITLQ